MSHFKIQRKNVIFFKTVIIRKKKYIMLFKVLIMLEWMLM